MSAPELLSQCTKLLKQMMRGFTLDGLYYTARRKCGRYTQQKMNMIRTDVTTNNLYILTSAYLSYQLPDSPTHFITQHRPAVFRYEDKVIMNSVYCVRTFAIILHSNTIIPQPPKGFA